MKIFEVSIYLQFTGVIQFLFKENPSNIDILKAIKDAEKAWWNDPDHVKSRELMLKQIANKGFQIDEVEVIEN